MGIAVLVSAAFYDAGARFGDSTYALVKVVSVGIVLSLLMGYKTLSFRELFHPSELPVRARLPSQVMPAVLIALGLFSLASELGNFLALMRSLSPAERELLGKMASAGATAAISSCLIAPFTEEMLFRGVFLRAFLWNYSAWRSILLSALLFGVAHGNVSQFLVGSIFGAVAGWLFVLTRSLWPCILAHAAYNAAVFLGSPMNRASVLDQTASQASVYSAAVVVGASAALAVGLSWLAVLRSQLRR